MDIFLAIVIVFTTSILGLIVYLHDRKVASAKLFLVMTATINLWVIANLLTNHNYGYSLQVNDATNRLAYAAGYLTVIAGVLFSYTFPTKHTVTFWEKTILLALSLPILLLSMTDLVAGTVTFDSAGAPSFTAGQLLWLYVVGFLGLVTVLTKNLLIVVHREQTAKKRQATLVLAAFGISALLGLFSNAILPLFADTWASTRLGPFVVVILIGTIAYSIVKHGLFDIKAAAVRSGTYILLLATLASLYFGLAYIVSLIFFQGAATSGVSASPVNIVLALILAFAFQSIKKFFDHWTNKLFYRDSYDTDDFIARLGRIVTGKLQLNDLLRLSLEEIVATLKASGGLFVVYRDHHDDVLVGDKEYGDFTGDEYMLLRKLVTLEGGDVVAVDTNNQNQLHRMLGRKQISLVLPLVSESETVGYLLLGQQMGSGYTRHDIRALETIANELVIAIMNARTVQVVRDLNIHLEERIEQATRELRHSNKRLLELDKTKDEFLSMASHQLRTPLTSVKGYISMVLEGDVGEVTPSQRQLLEEAYSSSERMVHLISDFLNVSRLQTGKFIIDPHLVNLAKITKQEVEGMQQIATTHNITIRYKPPARFPERYLDEGKIRQVIMNLIDNAIY